MALDVSPIFLIASGERQHDEPLRIRLSPTKAVSPHLLRQWIHGARPLLSHGDYATDEEAVAGYRLHIETQPRRTTLLEEEQALVREGNGGLLVPVLALAEDDPLAPAAQGPTARRAVRAPRA
jgi:hypothetical protein